MVDEAERYNISAIRDLLIDAFNAEELRDLFYFAQTPDLQAVPGQFAEGDSLPTMVRKAVRYCDSRFLLGEMLAEVKAANPRAYERYEALLKASPAPQPTPAPTPKPNAVPAATPTAAPAQGAKPALVLGRFPVWGLVAALAVVVALAVVLVLVLGPGPEPEPTPTEQALVTDTPTERVATDTPEVIITAVPIVTPTLTVTPTSVYEPGLSPRFVVAYRGADGVSIRSEAGTGYPEEATVYAGDLLEVDGRPKILGDISWWPVHKGLVSGWVAEWYGDTRLVKPYMEVDDAVEVVNPMSTGNVALRGNNCENLSTLSRGTALTVIGGPHPDKCDDPGDAISEAGRQWWYVETPEGRQGWVADFSAMEWPGFVKAVLVAPHWYMELTTPVGSTW